MSDVVSEKRREQLEREVGELRQRLFELESSRSDLTRSVLRDSEERFRAIFETALDSIFVKDVNLRYTHVNPAVARLFGRPAAELIGTTDEELFDEDIVARVREMDRRVLQGEVMEAVNSSVIGGVEHVFHTVKVPLRNVDGEVTGLCGIARDITEIKRAELVERVLGNILLAAATSADLKTLISKIRELLGTLIDTSNFYVALYDESTGRYSFPYYVDAYDTLEDYEPEPLPHSLTDYVRRTGAPALVDEAKFAELVEQNEVSLVGTDSVLWLGAPLITDRGVIGVVAVQSYHDAALYTAKDLDLLHYVAGTISIAVERKRAEGSRRALESKVLQSQKMESLGVLAGGIAHQFNNLLQSILGGTGIAAQLLPQNNPVHTQLKMIESAANDAAELTRQMLAYSGKSGFMVEEIDVSGLIEEMRELIEAAVADRAELRIRLHPKLPKVKADQTELRQVVMNLVNNAVESIGGGRGVIRVTTCTAVCDPATLAETYLGEDLPEGTYVALEVADTGCGMDANTQARIFDPFFSTKFTGRGLGLPAVLGIVRGIQGALRVDSQRGTGTTISVLIPGLTEHEAVSTDDAEAPQTEATGSQTVLVVDDDDVVRSLTQQMLEEAGFTVLAASDGRQALDLFRQSQDAIDVVLLDMTMPHMDGETTFTRLRHIRDDVPVIISSGYSTQDAMDRFSGPRPAGFLQKPYRLNDLLAAVRVARAG
jgi:PAS domain S-box-containing protein